MVNPILQMLNARNPAAKNSNNLLARVMEIKQLLSGQPVEAVYNRLLQNNPQFAQFVQQNQGKSMDDLAKEYGIDPQMLQSMFR